MERPRNTNIYQNTAVATDYVDFLNSEDGKIQQDVLFDSISNILKSYKPHRILDAACGSGWLTGRLQHLYPEIIGCDSSFPLLAYAREHHPLSTFVEADISAPLPYPAEIFDAIVVNMGIQDTENLPGMYQSLSTVLKPGGVLITTLPNPYYGFPIGAWKRGFFRVLLGKKPLLKLTHKRAIQEEGLDFNAQKPNTVHERPLAAYINFALTNGFVLKNLQELKSATDSPAFDLRYRLFRYPLILTLTFVKQ